MKYQYEDPQTDKWLDNDTTEEIVIPDEGEMVLCLANTDQNEEDYPGLLILQKLLLTPCIDEDHKGMPSFEQGVQ